MPTSTYPPISVLAHIIMCPRRFFTPAWRSHQNSCFFFQISWVRLPGPAQKKGWTWKSGSTLSSSLKKVFFSCDATMDDDINLGEDEHLADDFYDEIIRRRDIARRTNWRHCSTALSQREVALAATIQSSTCNVSICCYDYNESGNHGNHLC